MILHTQKKNLGKKKKKKKKKFFFFFFFFFFKGEKEGCVNTRGRFIQRYLRYLLTQWGVVACACNPAYNGSYKLIQLRMQGSKLSHVFRIFPLKVCAHTCTYSGSE